MAINGALKPTSTPPEIADQLVVQVLQIYLKYGACFAWKRCAELRNRHPGLPGLECFFVALQHSEDEQSVALSQLMELLAQSPMSPHPYAGLGFVHHLMRNEDLARKYLEISIDLAGDQDFYGRLLLTALYFPGDDYLIRLSQLHEWLKPRAYVEIGVARGDSFLFSKADVSIGIDPSPMLDRPPTTRQKIFKMTSDDFFVRHDLRQELHGREFDLAFIDGSHTFPQVLRDFANLEMFSGRNSIIALHDCLPIDSVSASQDRAVTFWTGDAWKAIFALRQIRPDLHIVTVPTRPSGLVLIAGLDARQRVIIDNIEKIVKTYVALPFSASQIERMTALPNDWDVIRKELERKQSCPASLCLRS